MRRFGWESLHSWVMSSALWWFLMPPDMVVVMFGDVCPVPLKWSWCGCGDVKCYSLYVVVVPSDCGEVWWYLVPFNLCQQPCVRLQCMSIALCKALVSGLWSLWVKFFFVQQFYKSWGNCGGGCGCCHSRGSLGSGRGYGGQPNTDHLFQSLHQQLRSFINSSIVVIFLSQSPVRIVSVSSVEHSICKPHYSTILCAWNAETVSHLSSSYFFYH